MALTEPLGPSTLKFVEIGNIMEFLQDNLAIQIVLLALGLGLVGFFGWRAVKDRKAKAAKKRGR